jgi:hypothetical protein
MNIAHAGCADGKRALVSLSRANDPSHVLHARVLEVPDDQPLAEALREHPGFRELVEEANNMGLYKLMKEFQPLLDGQACPRCTTVGKLELSQIWNPTHPRY